MQQTIPTEDLFHKTRISRLLEDIESKGWSAVSNLFPVEITELWAAEFDRLGSLGLFQAAQIKRAAPKGDPVRKDWTLWITEQDLQFQEFFAFSRELAAALNHHFFLSLKSFECHLALYEAGSYYQKHVDQFKDSDHRKLSMILYLNPSWKVQDGGQLKIYSAEKPEEVLIEIAPQMGTLVLFRSDLFPHEVAVANSPRKSITGWFRDDALTS